MLVLRLFIWNKATQDLEKILCSSNSGFLRMKLHTRGRCGERWEVGFLSLRVNLRWGFNREHLTFLFISACSSLYRCSQNKTEATVVSRAPRPRLSRWSSDLWLPVPGNKTRGTTENGGSQTFFQRFPRAGLFVGRVNNHIEPRTSLWYSLGSRRMKSNMLSYFKMPLIG